MGKLPVSPALREAFRITRMLDTVLGEDRFDTAPVQVDVNGGVKTSQVAAQKSATVDMACLSAV